MTTKSQSSRHEDVSFRFLGHKWDNRLSGTVIVRDGEMVLEVSGSESGPYSIAGKAHSHWFEGKNSVHGMQYAVDAKWADLGGTCVGIWVEDGQEYLFSFD